MNNISGVKRQSGGWSLRGLVAAFALVAFVLSNFATQTHIHALAQSSQAGAAAQTGASLNQQQKPASPIDDPARCQLCQEFLVAGAYLTPAPITLPLPVLTAVVARPLVQILAIIRPATHGWLSRAPPLA